MNINYDQILKAVEHAVSLKGADYQYPFDGYSTSCYYVRNEQPSCIAAVALHHLGVPVSDLKRNEGVASDGISFTINGEAAVLTPKASYFLRTAQRRQDKGESWGSALAEAQTQVGQRSWDSEERFSYEFNTNKEI